METLLNVGSRVEMTAEALKKDIQQHLHYSLAKDKYSADTWDYYNAVVKSVMDRLAHRWLETQRSYYEKDAKRVYYISMEFLIGRLLDNALINLGLKDEVKQALAELELDYDEIRGAEWDAGLGNGGLGRLAACFLDSLASLGYAGYGYGIRYDYGIFYQKIENGEQIEYPDLWLRYGNPWSILRPGIKYQIPFYGNSVAYHDSDGRLRHRWENTKKVLAMAYDTPIPGYKNDVVNNLRLWKATTSKTFDLKSFNQGQYIDAVRDQQIGENISRVLYPNDKVFKGQELRLKQEFFLVSATLQDMLRRFAKIHDDWTKLPEKVAIQCNDTHPNLAIPEMMRFLLDEQGMEWSKAWDITTKVMAYTNHTLLPEALEKWPVSLMRNLLPRHLQIIYEINRRFLDSIKIKYQNDHSKIQRMSLISEGEEQLVKMGPLGILGSHKINGVAALHSELMKQTIFRDYYEEFPEKFTNKTNGITPRRWLIQCNQGLTKLINDTIGNDWETHLGKLKELEPYAEKAAFRNKFAAVKKEKKMQLATYIKRVMNETLDTDALFDIQIKRIHEYKRQLMACLHAITLYNRLKADQNYKMAPRVIMFAGKAAPGYHLAKQIIRLINAVADKVNNDPDTRDKLKVLFVPNYSVSLAEKLIPAADLSEQISTAGMEASGTGNMKFALNGALTIGTLDGANVEMLEEIGDENMFIFGMTVDQVNDLRMSGYNPWDYYHQDAELKLAIDQIKGGFFSPDNVGLFHDLVESITNGGDYFMVLADFRAYVDMQEKVDALYHDKDEWMRKAVLNTARMGKFSSDRTIHEYAEEIWGMKPANEP